MKEALDEDVPVLGLCFGGQMLARVLGADVHRGTETEIGWLPVGCLSSEHRGDRRPSHEGMATLRCSHFCSPDLT